MDFLFEYIATNTYWTIMLIIHGLLAVALLGALTHQAMSVLMPVRQAAEMSVSPRASARYRARATPPRFACCGL